MSDPAADSFSFRAARTQLRVDFAFSEGKQKALREAQAGAYWAVRSHFTLRDDAALAVLPTGSGKTALMVLLALSLAKRKVLVVAPAVVVRDQIEKEFRTLKLALETGALPAGAPTPSVAVVKHRMRSKADWTRALRDHHVVVATPDCVSPPADYALPPAELFDTVFFDEAHHLKAPTWETLRRHFRDSRIVGFTATPFRLDKKSLDAEIVYDYSLQRAIDAGIYAPIDFVPVEAAGTRVQRDRVLAVRALEELDALNQELGWPRPRRRWPRSVEAGEARKRRGKRDAEQRPKAKLLVRVDRKRDSVRIQRLYKRLGARLEVVNSKYSERVNKSRIKKAREDESCHGLISVGMLGEGMDMPSLRIAVLHSPHQSFPITLQFIGRICRMSAEFGTRSKLLAIPDEVQEHTRGLYELTANWETLIPRLADAATADEQAKRRFAHRSQPAARRREGGNVSLQTINPYFAVGVYRLGGQERPLSAIGEEIGAQLPEGVRLLQSEEGSHGAGGKWCLLIAETEQRPIWTTSDKLRDLRHDLFIYYAVGGLLFEYATARGLSRKILWKQLKVHPTSGLDPEQVQQAISQVGADQFFMIGIKNVARALSGTADFVMLAGPHSENAIGGFRTFAFNHAFGRVPWEEERPAPGVDRVLHRRWQQALRRLREAGMLPASDTRMVRRSQAVLWNLVENDLLPDPASREFLDWARALRRLIERRMILGVSAGNSRIWASTRRHQMEFLVWCDLLAARLLNRPRRQLPDFGRLRRGRVRRSFGARPFAARLNESFYEQLESGLEVHRCKKAEAGHEKPRYTKLDLGDGVDCAVAAGSWSPGRPQACSLVLSLGQQTARVRCDVAKSKQWFREVDATWRHRVRVRQPDGRWHAAWLEDYLAENPPTVFLVDGGAAVGNFHYPYRSPEYNLPARCLHPVDWKAAQCDIRVEETPRKAARKRALEASGRVSVHEATEHLLREWIPDAAVIFCDHGANEVADFVAVAPTESGVHIHLVHCKASSKGTPGVRVGDAYDVLGQARKSLRWPYRSDLFETLRRRMESKERNLVLGTLTDFNALVARARPQTSSYTVHVVQPGFDLEALDKWKDESLRLMFLSLYDELEQQGVELRVAGTGTPESSPGRGSPGTAGESATLTRAA